MYHMGNTFVRFDLDQNMHMILHDGHLMDIPLVKGACFIKELFEADGYFADKDPFSIFRYPHEVDFQTMLRMCSSPIASLSHTLQYAAEQSLRPTEDRWATGRPSSPCLKARGFRRG